MTYKTIKISHIKFIISDGKPTGIKKAFEEYNTNDVYRR